MANDRKDFEEALEKAAREDAELYSGESTESYEKRAAGWENSDDAPVKRGKYSSSQERLMLLEYELTLMGKANTQKIQKGFFNSPSKKRNSDMAMKVLKYAFETVLQWTPDQVLHYATEDVVKNLALGYPYSKLDLPRELVRSEERYIAGMMYPQLKILTLENLTLLTYRNVLATAAGKFPKEYFSENASGRDRALVCLRYLLSHKVAFDSQQELIDTFRTEKTGEEFLKTYGLLTAKETLYHSCMEYLAEAYPNMPGINAEANLTRYMSALSKSGLKKELASHFKQRAKVHINPFRDSFRGVINAIDGVTRTRLDRLFVADNVSQE